MNLQDSAIPDSAIPDWYIDTGATAHLHADPGILKSSSNICNKSNFSVLVGDGSQIPVLKTGHTTLGYNPFRTLTLKHVLITPKIIKNIVYVRKFTHDNKCSIEFDEFDFSMKDYLTKQILLRCDSTGDLYLVTSQSHQAFISVGPSMWHQRLGHPGDQVLKHLVSQKFISCNKKDSPLLCHACQLGRHVRLSFSLSKTNALFPFQVDPTAAAAIWNAIK